MGDDIGKLWVHDPQRDLYKNNCVAYAVASNYIIVFPSYSTLLTLRYGDRMEKSWVACHWAEEEGLSIREVERVVESEMFLDKYPWWEFGTPHWTVILHEMFLHAAEWGGKRWNICATKVTKATYQNLILRQINLPWS